MGAAAQVLVECASEGVQPIARSALDSFATGPKSKWCWKVRWEDYLFVLSSLGLCNFYGAGSCNLLKTSRSECVYGRVFYRQLTKKACRIGLSKDKNFMYEPIFSK